MYWPPEELHEMGKSQKSTNEDFFLTDENDGYNSYGLKSAVRDNAPCDRIINNRALMMVLGDSQLVWGMFWTTI